MPHSRCWVTGGVDDEIDGLFAERRLRIINNPRRTRTQRRSKIGTGVAFARPADARQVFASTLRVDVGNDSDMKSWCPDRLGEEHRGELSAPDNTDADRIVLSLPSQQQAVKIHATASAVPGIDSVRQLSDNGSMGAKSRWAIHSGRLKRRMWLSTWHSER